MIWKRFRIKKSLTPLLNRLRPSPALRSWLMGHALLNRGLLTAQPWLVLHRRSWLGPREGFLLCDKIPGKDLTCLPDSLSKKWQRIDQLARCIRLMHERGVVHRDLKAANFLLDDNKEEAITFIDLVGSSRAKNPTIPRRVKDLMRLNASFLANLDVTRTDKLRFLRVYLHWGLEGRANWKIWWTQIAEATSRKQARNLKRGRPLG